MDWEKRDYENFLFFLAREKSADRGSYDYVSQGRAGNPTSIYPKSFVPKKDGRKLSFNKPIGTMQLIMQHDPKTIEDIRKIGLSLGLKQGTVCQLRRNFGGPALTTEFKKARFKMGGGRQNAGTRILIRHFQI